MIKKTIIALLLSLFIAAPALASTKTQQQPARFVMNMFGYLQSYRKQQVTVDDLKQFYTPSVEMITNGAVVAKGYQGFYHHFQMLLTHLTRYHFVFPYGRPLQDNHHVIVHYIIDFSEHGFTSKMYVVAIMTFDHGKISKWDEVVGKKL